MEEIICYTLIFIAEAIIAWLYYEHLYEPRKNASFQILSYGGCYTILLAIFFLRNVALNAILLCIANSFLARINYSCSIKISILHGIFLTFVLTGTELLTNLLIVGLGQDFSAYIYDFNVLIAMAIISKLLYLAIALLGAKLFKAKSLSSVNPKLTVIFVLLPLFSVTAAVLIIYLGLSSEMTRVSSIMMLFTVFSLLVVNLLFMILHKYWQKANEEQFLLQLGIQKERADVAYYSALQEQFENQRILIHDIKSHLRIIDELAKRDRSTEISDYIYNLAQDLLPSTYAKLCDDPILNMILLQYRSNCDEHNVEFKYDIREGATVFMDAPSITTLYGNLLSNAFEAACCTEARQMEISVIKNSEQSFVVITVTNSCDQVPIPNRNGFFQTTKTNEAVHGIGLKSINRVVKLYNGVSYAYYDEDSRKFHHVIQIPISN